MQVSVVGHASFQEPELTLYLVLQHFDLRVGIVDELVHLLAEHIVLLSQSLGKMFLVDDLLSCLVAVESQTTTCTFHDDGGAEATQHTRLIVFCGIENSYNHVISVVQLCATSWAGPVRVWGPRQIGRVGALRTEDMASSY